MPRRPHLYILKDIISGEPEPCEDVLAWAQWFETAHRVLAHDRDESGTTPVWVSTVFLGMDMNHLGEGPPLLWETMIFSGAGGENAVLGIAGGEAIHQERYATREAAMDGHQRACAFATKLAAFLDV